MINETPKTTPDWKHLLERAVNEPGIISEAYSRFHGYSFGNCLLALAQCWARGIQPGPIATYPKWAGLGRYVKRGEKAIMLCMPVTCKRKSADENEEDATFTRFTYKNNWFVLSQTDGAVYLPAVIPEWNRSAAIAGLNIQEVPFELVDGNTLGYARGREIAISPLSPDPDKTTFHELAHILLGHTSEGKISDSDNTPRSLREVEAESVALICCESLGLSGAEYSRGYIQNWNRGAGDIPERSAQKIFHAADQILKAGRAKEGL